MSSTAELIIQTGADANVVANTTALIQAARNGNYLPNLDSFLILNALPYFCSLKIKH